MSQFHKDVARLTIALERNTAELEALNGKKNFILGAIAVLGAIGGVILSFGSSILDGFKN